MSVRIMPIRISQSSKCQCVVFVQTKSSQLMMMILVERLKICLVVYCCWTNWWVSVLLQLYFFLLLFYTWTVSVDALQTDKPGCLFLSHRTGKRSSPPCWPAPVLGSRSHSGEVLSGHLAAPLNVHIWKYRQHRKTHVSIVGIISLDQETRRN